MSCLHCSTLLFFIGFDSLHWLNSKVFALLFLDRLAGSVISIIPHPFSRSSCIQRATFSSGPRIMPGFHLEQDEHCYQ